MLYTLSNTTCLRDAFNNSAIAKLWFLVMFLFVFFFFVAIENKVKFKDTHLLGVNQIIRFMILYYV